MTDLGFKALYQNIEEHGLERLKKRTIINIETNCWEWQGSNNGMGYGEIRIGYKKFYTHRLSGYLHLGLDLFGDLQINHKCNNKKCWNPNHLYVGDAKDNMKDSIDNGYMPGNYNSNKTHCKHGHEYTPENTQIINPKGRNPERRCKTCI